MEEFIDNFKLENCWYKDTCKKVNTDDCDMTCVRYVKMDYLVKKSLITEHQQRNLKLIPDEIDLKEFERLKNIQTSIKQFVNENNSLLIYSENVGNGKTTWAVKLLLSFLDSIWLETMLRPRALFISVQEYLQLKTAFNFQSEELDYIDDNLYKVDLIVWDDVGVKALGVREQTILGSIIDKRLRLGLSNIYTTNLSAEQLLLNMGERLYSRIYNTSTIIHLQGDDKRGAAKW